MDLKEFKEILEKNPHKTLFFQSYCFNKKPVTVFGDLYGAFIEPIQYNKNIERNVCLEGFRFENILDVNVYANENHFLKSNDFLEKEFYSKNIHIIFSIMCSNSFKIIDNLIVFMFLDYHSDSVYEGKI